MFAVIWRKMRVRRIHEVDDEVSGPLVIFGQVLLPFALRMMIVNRVFRAPLIHGRSMVDEDESCRRQNGARLRNVTRAG